MLQNLLYFWNKKTQIVFFVYHFEQLWTMSTYRPGHVLLHTNPKMLEMQNEKAIWVFLFQK